jgi:hypothetical protein
MGILYGAMIANMVPRLVQWWSLPTALAAQSPEIPALLRWCLLLMGVGVFLSGARDLYAAFGLPHGAWPWKIDAGASAEQ